MKFFTRCLNVGKRFNQTLQSTKSNIFRVWKMIDIAAPLRFAKTSYHYNCSQHLHSRCLKWGRFPGYSLASSRETSHNMSWANASPGAPQLYRWRLAAPPGTCSSGMLFGTGWLVVAEVLFWFGLIFGARLLVWGSRLLGWAYTCNFGLINKLILHIHDPGCCSKSNGL